MNEVWRLTVEVRPLGMLHVAGPGRPRPLVDRTVAVDARGRPYLPASSVRGRVRAHLERLLRAYGLPVCTPPRPQHMCPHAGLAGTSDGYCLACRLFGSPWRAGAVTVNDFYPVGVFEATEAEWERNMVVRTGIGISRKLGTVREERLFFTEAVPGDDALRFRGTLEARAERAVVGWLVGTLGLVTHLGGQKGRGLGRVELDVSGVAVWTPGRGWEEMTEHEVESFCREVVSLALAGTVAG
ncbi:protein of unknown function DUF324 [Candidatus Desulforudis audaxviator MP104C]|uniref:CRISPR type III-associated protein domain-containing protein n=1 Tax=Desulforudis audaxviator (strain MP104C) TaxID=477974 RepID=B1I5N5_DESAP|nr:protein of unknown function DUF324 [Candidatus Desulforudis audaxviator MP104C]AZK60348.1 DUF324 domain-containing protein [Candidatus Desulforudis audaxviator]